MAKEFRFPDVGEGITEGEIVRWLVKEGDEVKVDETLAEIETDKAIVEMPSPYAGTVLKLHAPEKGLVKVGQPLVTIGEKGESLAAPPEKKPAVKVKVKYDLYGNLERVPLRGVRRATARKMRESLDHAAHVTHCDEADAGPLEALLRKMRPEAEARGVKLTYLAFIVKALVEALKLHAAFNASLDEDESEIVLKKYYNIGIAVDVPDGLIVPVVKFADQKSVIDIAQEIQALAGKARERTVDLADLQGGTFSITNVGVIGGQAATPIINYPEAAILATMKIADRPRVVDGQVAVRKTLPLCLAFDHRIVDGAAAARFIKDLIRFLEAPEGLPLKGE